VDLGEVLEVGEIHVHLHGLCQRAARRLRHRLEVLEHAADLRLDVPADELHARRVEGHLAGQIDGVADAHRLRVGTDRLRGALGVDDLTAHHGLLGWQNRRGRLQGPRSASPSLSLTRTPRAWAAMVRSMRETSGMRRMTRTRRARWRRSRTRSSKLRTAVSLSCSSIET